MKINDKTIDVFSLTTSMSPNKEYDFSQILRRASKKRKWFDPAFYHCHPLFIANQYGFEIVNDTDFTVLWNGEPTPEDLIVSSYYGSDYEIRSHFGFGIVTFGVPFLLKTSPKVNLFLTNPFNHDTFDRTCLSAVIETDNLDFTFSINIRVMPNKEVTFKRGDVLCTVLPIPRYFQDDFELQNGYEAHTEQELAPMLEMLTAKSLVRNNLFRYEKHGWDKTYKAGMDIKGNYYPDHQKTVN